MNAYVIDQNQLKKYVVEIVVALVIAFSLGFVLGMQQSKVDNEIAQHEKSRDQKTLEGEAAETTPTDAETDSKKTALSSAEKIKLAKEKTANEKIDLKEQEKIAQEKLALKKLAEKKLAKQKLEKEKLAKQKLAKEKLAKEKLAKEKLAREKLEKEKQAKAALEKKNLEAKQAAETNKTTESSGIAAPAPVEQTQSNTRVFSIQAGMFASKSNADSFIKKLEAKQFKAYVSDFQSSTGTTKYNVRVGRFDNREQARDLLKDFQKSFTTPAYVVIAQ